MSDPVLCEIDRGVATVTLNRPERKNAWTDEMERRYLGTLDALDRDPEVRAVVVTGSGDAFCPGLDFEALAETSRGAEGLDPTRSIGPVLMLGVPLVAAINGACAGIGLVQALACDVRFAADEAKLATSFARRGTVAELATAWLLPRIVGHANALDLLLSGRTVRADEAAALGLVNRVVAPERLLDEAHAYARDLAARVRTERDGRDQAAGLRRLDQLVRRVRGAGVPVPRRTRADGRPRRGLGRVRGTTPPELRAVRAGAGDERELDCRSTGGKGEHSMSTLDGRVAIVTGAARGLGADYARYLAEDGAAVVVADIDGEGAAQTAKEIVATGGRALAVDVDVADNASVLKMVEATKAEFGGVDILINNAGIWKDLEGVFLGILEIEPEYWDHVLRVNLTGSFLCTRAVYPSMVERGWGRIINISSIASRIPAGIYGLSKLAVNQLSFAAAHQLGDSGITVNSIAPGIIDNEATRSQMPDEILDGLVSQLAVKRRGTSRDLYSAIAWLCSEQSGWTTGQTIHVNGGQISLM